MGTEEWIVGVARNSVRRKGMIDFCPEEGFWTVGKGPWEKESEYRAFNDGFYTPLSLSQEPKRIRVTLNYSKEKVSFSDADTGDHLYTHSAGSFWNETLLPIFWVSSKAHLRLSS